MRIHHLNCGCMCPVGGRLFDGFSEGVTSRLVCQCLLVETSDGLVLVDTGFGTRDVERRGARISPFFVAFNNIQFEPRLTALRQIESLGYRASDVRHIVLTHLDFDHAGGLEDFPGARVHLLRAERDAARDRRGFIASRRYSPRQWDEVKAWELYEAGGEGWFGFEAVRDLRGLPPEILMVPLAGHTPGHAGVAIDTPEGWLLLAGDAYFYRHEMDAKPRCTPGLAFYQRMMEVDRPARLRNQARLRRLANDPRAGVRITCSHDAAELEALQRLSGTGPVPVADLV